MSGSGHASARGPVGALALLVLVLGAGPVGALPVAGGAADGPSDASSSWPRYRARTEWPLVAVGTGALAASFAMSRDHDPVPPPGLDPSAIRWKVDRNVVGNRDESADNLSNWTRNAALVFPLAVVLATSPGGERLAGLGHRAGLWAEAYLVGQGVVRLGKTRTGRARPFTYLPETDRPDTAPYDVTADRAFRGMPSGHAATSWTAAAIGITEHLLSRPHASRAERLSVSFLGGALAGTTAALRVRAGQHFPTDVVAGGALGATLGVTVPLLHRGDRPLPSRRTWLEAAGAAAAGAAVGAFAATL